MKFKSCDQKDSLEFEQPAKCTCNQKYDYSFPQDELPPPAPPCGRDDLWDLQFCRWWGWNWVRRREAESAKCDGPKQTMGCATSNRSKEQECQYASPQERSCPLPRQCAPRPTGCFPPPRQVKGRCIRPSPPPDDFESADITSSPKQPMGTQQACVVSTRNHFREMCKCLLGKRQKATCHMADLYNTPSSSTVALERYSKVLLFALEYPEERESSADYFTRFSYGVTEKTVMPVETFSPCRNNKRKCRKQALGETQCKVQSWSKASERISEPELTISEEVNSEPVCFKKNFSSTEESIDYLTVRLQHITSDICCPCLRHEKKKKCKPECVEKCHDQTQTYLPVQDHKETQTHICKKTCHQPTQCRLPKRHICNKEEMVNLKSKRRQTICICICCCGPCKKKREDAQNVQRTTSNESSPGTGNPSIGLKKDIQNADRRASKGSILSNNLNNNEDQSIELTKKKSTRYKSNRVSVDESQDTGKKTKCDGHPLKKGDFDLRKDLSRKKDHQVNYSVIMPPSNTKMLSKFGAPSKNYPWMQNIGSDETTTTLNNLEPYKSPVSGKTYDFPTFDFENPEKYTLPELIDITDDLTYLKTIEHTTNKSDNENRLLLDAVCDVILHEHEEKSLDLLQECHLNNGPSRRDFTDLEILCDLQREVCSKTDVYTEVSKPFFNTGESVGVQRSSNENMNNDKYVKVGHLDYMLTHIFKNLYTDSDSCCNFSENKNLKANNREPFKSKCETISNKPFFEFKGPNNDNASTKTGLLLSTRCSFSKKPIKREASDSAKDENSSKKLRQEEAYKINNQETDDNIRRSKQTCDRIGSVFTKIEDIVKQSKIKSSEIQRVLSFAPTKEHPSEVFRESVLKTHSLNQNCSLRNSDVDANSFKRTYKMSSDAFNFAICSSAFSKTSEHKTTKNIDEIFSGKFDNSQNDYPTSCSRSASAILLVDGNASSGQRSVPSEILSENNGDGETTTVKKASKLSIKSFIVCDEKSTTVRKSLSSCGSKRLEKKVAKKKKIVGKGSLIPIRKQSS